MEHEPLTLLYLAHLNSDHVWQRPQQLMSRFATRCQVLYVDPPQVVSRDESLHLQERPGVGAARVIRPIFPERLTGARERQLRARQAHTGVQPPLDEPQEGNFYRRLWLQLLPELLDEVGPNTILWVSSPLADYLVAAARSRVRLVVYDCMDDLASFRDGTDDMRRRENNLLKLADLLFTGGYSMYAARKDRHPRAYCFPSGVDVAHFRRAQAPAIRVPAAVARIARPRLGYFGVLDERIDWNLIGEVAAQRPDWQWVLVGPFAKVKRSELPEAPNIHYLGKRAYSRLPGYLKG
ncbi:MAG TPA: hypothetical protein VER55_11415, partial [Ardenticatenaceae bacterium]|nr:hypothetical protein [Ardenticatenaceae bacterium]